MEAKAKISVTVDRGLLRRADTLGGSMSRSRIVEEALATWILRKGRADLDRATESYYQAQGIAERHEDDAWASLGDETVRRGWGD